MESQTQAIEADIKNSQLSVELGKSLERLRLNRDFKQVIQVGYLTEEAVRLVYLKAAPNMQDAVAQRHILSQLDSIGCLQQYLLGISSNVEMAEKAIEASETVLDELRTESP